MVEVVRTTFVSATFYVWVSLFCVLASDAHARKYFVTRGPQGADSNDGTSHSPLRRIATAIRRATPGDKVIVMGGDYRQEGSGWGKGIIPIVDKDASSGATIEIRPAVGATATLGRILIRRSSNIRIQGFQFAGTKFERVANWQDMPTTVRDSFSTNRPDFTGPYEDRAGQIENEFQTYLGLINTLRDTPAIELEDSTRIVVRDTIVDGYFAGVQCRNSSQVRVFNNQFSHNVYGVVAWEGLIDSDIYGNKITQSLDNGIDIRGSSRSVLIQDNDVSYSGHSHVVLLDGVSKCRVLANDVYYGGYYSETLEYPGNSAISVNDCGQGIFVENNWVAFERDSTGIDGNGIILDLMRGGSRVTVRENFVWQNEGAGLNTTESPNALIIGNVFLENGFGPTQNSRGAGIKFSRAGDVDQTATGNRLLFNYSAGIQSSGTIAAQRRIDENLYRTEGTPLIWDSENPSTGTFFTIESIRSELGWELSGRWTASNR